MNQEERLKLEQFYVDARERASSAERIMSEAIRGVVLLNGGAVAVFFTGIGLQEKVPLAVDAAAIESALQSFIVGVLLGIGAVAAFSMSSFCRGYFEFEQAERIFHSGRPEQGRHVRLSAVWLAGYVTLLVATLILAAGGLFAFSAGAQVAAGSFAA